MTPASTYQCKYCLQEIKQKAKVCHHCSRHQNRLVQYSDRIGLLISIVMVGIALFQLNEARQERIVASEAVPKAETLAASLIRVTYIQAITKNEFGNSPRLKKAQEIKEKELNKVLELRFANKEERKTFLQELTNELPPREN